MRTLLLALCLLAAPVLLLPSAAADEYCWEAFGGNVCCLSPDPVGNPGSLPYVVTDAAGNTWIATCGTSDRAVVGAGEFVDCVVFNRC